MTFPEAIRTCFRKYATFSGRASRSEFWWFALFALGGSLLLTGLNVLLFGTQVVELPGGRTVTSFGGGALGWVFSVATMLPLLAVTCRRLHDRDLSGWWILAPYGVMLAGAWAALGVAQLGGGMATGVLVLAILPLGTMAWLAVMLSRPGTPGPNRFGPPPSGPPPHDSTLSKSSVPRVGGRR